MRSTTAMIAWAMVVLEASAVGQFITRMASASSALQQDLQRAPVTLGVGVADDVDRVAVRPCRRQDGVERRASVASVSLARLPSRSAEPIGREHAGAAAIGEDGEPVASEPRMPRTGSRRR